jgi:STE24 endopeptidase
LWWFYAWAAFVAFQYLMMWLYPTVIAPLFNKFHPLADETLKAQIEALMQRCGFKSAGLFVMDGSKRSSHGNAYFSGFGANKRIVFFDTLIERLAPIEMEAVLAHELGHFKLRHVVKRMLWSAVISLGAFAFLGWLGTQAWFYLGLGFTPSLTAPNDAAALVLFMMALPAFSFVLGPAGSWASRKHEFEADAFAAKQSDKTALVSALVKLYEDNGSTLTPDPIYSAFYYSHPPASVRIGRLQAL